MAQKASMYKSERAINFLKRSILDYNLEDLEHKISVQFPSGL